MTSPTPIRTPLSALLLAALAACGGSGPAPQPAAPVVPASVLVSGRAVDGPLQGASACYDLNDNGACDAGEPVSAATDAAGRFSIAVDAAHAGRHRVVVNVPASAIDADTGAAVGAAFTLRAPASGQGGAHSVFVSPLTTLVQAHTDATGATLAEAVALVQAQAGLAMSPLDDFTAGSGEAQRHAALVARLLQLTALAQAADLAGLVGSPDRLGGVVTQAVLDAEIARSLVAALPAVAGAAIDPALAGASGPALQATLQRLARALAAQVGLSAAQVQAGATASALAEPPQVPGVATATLAAFRYTDVDNWFVRLLQTSADDSVPDAQNDLRYYDQRLQSSSTGLGAEGVVTGWARGNTPARAGDLHWSGSAWVDCKLTDRFSVRVRDAQGRSVYRYCNNLEQGASVRRVVDIGGRTQFAVVQDLIRSFPSGANWGPADLGNYGSATFPAGSALHYQTNTATQTAYGYDVQPGNIVTAFNAAVAAGGDVRVNPSLACNDPAQNTSAAMAPVLTLETLVARNTGKPCIFFQAGVTPDFSLNPNEWWGNSTVNLGDLANTNPQPGGTGNYYNTTATLRVAFAASGDRATFYRCYRRASDDSPRNCSLLGLGRWSIQTLGDGRVLGFSVQPALAQKLGYARAFVERGGQVYYGYKNPVGGASTDIRLNLTAANAVMLQLGLPRIRPVTQPGTASGARAATLSTLQGAWGGAGSNGNEAQVFRFGADGRFFMAEANAPDSFLNTQSGAELGWFDHDPATGFIANLLEVDSNLTAGTSHPTAAEMRMRFTITATAVTDDAGNLALGRLETVATTGSLVGLWALDSATDLSVPHLAFFSNGRVMLVHHKGDPGNCVAANECPPGVELASYSFDAVSGEMRAFGVLYDTNGCTGLFNTCPTAVAQGAVNTETVLLLTLAADGLTATFLDGTVTRTLHRIPAQ
ncbi:MAG: hypothetical protein Q8K45_13175 [Rubrivivax sp.]|nr:hypothetical protein [Rubrivivax sp.]